MIRHSRRRVVARALGLAVVPWLAGARVEAQDPRDGQMSVDSTLGQHLAWQEPWFLKVHQPFPETGESIVLLAPHAQFAFVLHLVAALSPEFRSSAALRDSLIETPERWNLDILSVFSDARGDQALLVDRDTDQVYYYCIAAVNSDYLLELGFYAGLQYFDESWDLAKGISLDGNAVFAGFDEAKILGPVSARANAKPDAMPDEAERAYLVSMWTFYARMRSSTDRIQTTRRQASPGDDVIAAIEPDVHAWTASIRDVNATIRPGPDFEDLDRVARETSAAYAAAGDQYDTIAEGGDLAQSLGWSVFLGQLAVAEGLLQQMKQAFDQWEIPAVDA